MARKKLVELTIETTPEVAAVLRRLMTSGFYCDTIERTAEQLLRERVRQLEEQEQRQAAREAFRAASRAKVGR